MITYERDPLAISSSIIPISTHRAACKDIGFEDDQTGELCTQTKDCKKVDAVAP
jgi:hypothetical protein